MRWPIGRERLEEDKASLADDIKDVMGEAKGRGYDTLAIRTIVRLRKKDANERIEEETILQTYMAELGMEWCEQPINGAVNFSVPMAVHLCATGKTAPHLLSSEGQMSDYRKWKLKFQ